MSVEAIFLDYSVRKLEQSMARVAECLSRLTAEQIWWRPGEESNAVGNLMLHLEGNVRQWIVSGLGGVPCVRERDAEFAAREGAADLVARLQATVSAAVAVIRAQTDLERRVTIQGYEELPVLEAIYHVVEHFSGHTGQIILVTKAVTGRPTDFYAHLSAKRAHEEKTP